MALADASTSGDAHDDSGEWRHERVDGSMEKVGGGRDMRCWSVALTAGIHCSGGGRGPFYLLRCSPWLNTKTGDVARGIEWPTWIQSNDTHWDRSRLLVGA